MNKEIGVLLLYFNKVEPTEKVLKRILEAKPGILLLSQDGSREGNLFDQKAVPRCRECVERLVEEIDWECEVYRNYSEVNMGCDPKEFSAISWAFSIVDKLIIIEDDCLCSYSFFEFMNEMLIKYENDNRICMISGTERFGRNPFCKESYYFTQASCGCGWGSWKRVWNDVERISNGYDFILDEEKKKNIDIYVKKTCLKVYADYIKKSEKNRIDNMLTKKMQSWEFAVSTAMILESRVAISPAVNLVKNIGAVPGSTHSGNDIRTIPKRNRMFFELENYEMEFPLVHPVNVIRNMQYEAMHDKVYAPNILHKLTDDLERLFLLVKYGHMKDIFVGVCRRLKRFGSK